MNGDMDVSEGVNSKPARTPVPARKAGKRVAGVAHGSSLSLVRPASRLRTFHLSFRCRAAMT